MSQEAESIVNSLPDTAQKQLRQLLEQYERLEEEKKAIASDQRDKLAEVQACGFDVKTFRKVLALRKKSREERAEEDAITAVYLHALGMIDEDEMHAAAQPMATGTTGRTRRTPYKARKADDRTPANGYQPDN